MKNRPTIDNISNLATTLLLQGKYNKAEQMYQNILILRKEILGIENLSTLDSISDIVLVLCCQEKYKEAEKMYRETLVLIEQVLGMTHKVNTKHYKQTCCSYLLSTKVHRSI
jgi:tetratricopeptide (TPR) repeat protein